MLMLYSAHFCLLQRIPGHVDASPTSIAVVDESPEHSARIFTAGLDGTIYEIDTENGRTIASSDSYGGAVWSMAVEPPREDKAKNIEMEKIKEDAEDNIQIEGNGLHHGNDNLRSQLPVSSSDEEDNEPQAYQDAKIQPLEQYSISSDPLIAVACDDGCVRLFSVNASQIGVTYVKSLPRVEGRCLAVAWHPNGEILASTGTDGCIHVWNIRSNHELLRITAGDSSGEDICVWTVIILQDGTIVTGDSQGSVAFWDGRFGTLLSRFNQHEADVLQLACSADGSLVFAAGVDPRIAVFHRVQRQREVGTSKSQQADNEGEAKRTIETVEVPEWVFLSSKRPHTHDVRTLCIANTSDSDAVLFSGGNDTLLKAHLVKRFLKEHPKVVDECPQKSLISAVSGCKNRSATEVKAGLLNDRRFPIMMAAVGNRLDIWHLASASQSLVESTINVTHKKAGRQQKHSDERVPQEGERLSLKSIPVHIAQLVNDVGQIIVALSISEDGRFFAYSDGHKLHCFQISGSESQSVSLNDLKAEEKIRISPIHLPENLSSIVFLCFTDGTKNDENHHVLMALSLDGNIKLITLRNSSSDGMSTSAGTPRDPEEKSATVQNIRIIHDLRYKMWLKRDRTKTMARRMMPLVDPKLTAYNPKTNMLAVMVHGRIQVVSMQSQHLVIQIPPPVSDSNNVTALGFTSDGSILIAAVAKEPYLFAFEMPSGMPTKWLEQNMDVLSQKLSLGLPGPIRNIAPSPLSSKCVLLQSSHAVCYLDLDAPLQSPDDRREHKRQYRPKKLASSTGTSFNVKMPPSMPPGQNCRFLYSSNPLLFIKGIETHEIIAVERPWKDVHQHLPPPLYRHRYGS